MFMCLRFKVWEKAFTQRKLIYIESSWSNQGKCRLQEWGDWRVGSGFSVYAMKKTFLIAFKPPECQAKKKNKANQGTWAREILFSPYLTPLPVSFLSDLLNWVSCEGVIGLADNQIVKKKNDQKSTLANCDLKKETCLSCRLSNTVHLCNKEKKTCVKGPVWFLLDWQIHCHIDNIF